MLLPLHSDVKWRQWLLMPWFGSWLRVVCNWAVKRNVWIRFLVGCSFFTQSDQEHECLHVCVFIIDLMFGVKCVSSPADARRKVKFGVIVSYPRNKCKLQMLLFLQLLLTILIAGKITAKRDHLTVSVEHWLTRTMALYDARWDVEGCCGVCYMLFSFRSVEDLLLKASVVLVKTFCWTSVALAEVILLDSFVWVRTEERSGRVWWRWGWWCWDYIWA